MFPFQNPSLPDSDRVQDLLTRLTINEKIGLLSTHQMPVERLNIGEWFVGHEIARGLVNREADKPSTVFPQPIGMAASFDPDMMYEIGKTAAREARAYHNEHRRGGLMVWGPTVDLSRDPRWGRNEECYGEDPFLTGEMTIAYTKGLRGDDRICATIPTLKHFCANNHEEGRASDSANLTPRLRHEHYYAAFRAPITRGGAMSVMTAYNEICHAPAVMNHDLKSVLKDEWGLCFVVTDGADFSQNVTAHGTFDSHAMSLKACLNAGADCMTDSAENVHAAARKALAEGILTEEEIDKALACTLTARLKLGHFDAETPFDRLTRADVNTDADRALNLRAAKEGMVLLENNGILPLSKKTAGTIALLGAYADCNLLDWYTGTSSYQISIKQGLLNAGCTLITDEGWDIVKIEAPNGKFLRLHEDGAFYADADEENAEEFYYCLHDNDKSRTADHDWVNLKSVRDGRLLRIPDNGIAEYGETTVYGWFTKETLRFHRHSLTGKLCISHYLHGNQFTLDAKSRLVTRPKARPDANTQFALHCVSLGADRLAQIAKQADTVIYCAGNDPEQMAKECHDRRSIALPTEQENAVLRLLSEKIPLVLVMTSSYPFALHFQRNRPAAILWSSHAGPELGTAMAATLFGENNPAGRLPQTWYACDEDLPSIKDYDIMHTKMTYLWFDGKPLYPFGHGLSYSRFAYSGLSCTAEEGGILVRLKVENTSQVSGDEVVQVYVSAKSERIERPRKKLCGFARITIPAGECADCSIFVPYRELMIYDVSREKFCLEAGEYAFHIGASSEDIRLTENLFVRGETVPPRDFSAKTPAQLFDAQENMEIHTDPLTGETHVRGKRWGNSLTYQNVDFSGKTELRLKASAIVEPVNVSVLLDDAETPLCEAVVPSCDGYTDFAELILPVSVSGTHDLRLQLPSGCCVKSLQLR